MNAEQLFIEAKNLKQQLIQIRRDLHQYPELSMKEYETTLKIRTYLNEMGIEILPLNLPVGIVAEIRGPKPGPTVAIRADIDALPIEEQTGLPFASTKAGIMHACGHDFHTAAVLGSAFLLQKFRSQLQGSVRLIFQPGEEKAIGAKVLIDAGVLDGVDAIFGMHNKPDIPVGTIGLSTGALMASADGFNIKVIGKGGHGAIPDAAVDPIVAAAAIIGGLQTAISRSISPFESAVVSVCNVHAGTTWNIIPDYAVLQGTVRTFNKEVRAQMPSLLRRIVEGIANGYGAQVEFEWIVGTPAITNDQNCVNILRMAAEVLHLNITEAKPVAASEDFSQYQEKVPGCFIWMGTNGPEQWHHPQFTVDEEALVPSAALFALTAMYANQLK